MKKLTAEEIEINQIPIKQHKSLTMGHLKALKDGSMIIKGHTDPQSYHECWSFLQQYIGGLYEKIENNKHQPELPNNEEITKASLSYQGIGHRYLEGMHYNSDFKEGAKWVIDYLNQSLQSESKQPEMPSDCKWEYDEEYSFFNTECGKAYCLIDGTLEENNHKYCPYCGKKIILKTNE